MNNEYDRKTNLEYIYFGKQLVKKIANKVIIII